MMESWVDPPHGDDTIIDTAAVTADDLADELLRLAAMLQRLAEVVRQSNN
uniref:Uncharacterized protein n=1 Tax=viral metagenome TaxID=1070528 RepID=A0A6M3K3M1_9ZZZZ